MALVTVACLLVVGALVAATLDDVRTQQRLHVSEQRMEDLQVGLAVATARHGDLARSVRRTVRQRNADQAGLDSATTDLLQARRQLQAADDGSALLSLNIGAVSQCLPGVRQALDALRFGNTAAATGALGSVAGSCQAVVGSGTGGPVYPFDFADPSVIRVGTTYYAFGTNSATGNLQVMRSTTLTSWQPLGDALPHLAKWAAPDMTWAPAVIQVGPVYRLYYTAARAGGTHQCISVATAKVPQGPYSDTSKSPLVCNPDGSIDPYPYRDLAGHLYLTWKSEGAPGAGPPIRAHPLIKGGTALAPGPATELLVPSLSWQANNVEAPAMTYAGGSYWLLYSGNSWNTASYAVGAARCSGPLGPCAEVQSGPLLSSQPGVAGPGSVGVFTDVSGNLDVAFHGWLPTAVGYPHARLLFVRRLTVVDGMPHIVPLPAG